MAAKQNHSKYSPSLDVLIVVVGALGAVAAFVYARTKCTSSLQLGILNGLNIFMMAILWLYARSLPAKDTSHFRFLDLPAELREHIYSYSIDRDPVYPAKLDDFKPRNALERLIQGRPKVTGSQALLLTSRQIHNEYVSVLAKTATFTLIIDENNYDKPITWSMSPTTLSTLRHLRLELRLKPSMMGTFDPRHASQSPSIEWPLYSRLLTTISKMEKLKTVDLYVHACGNPIWNPLWLWHYASQTFKGAEISSPTHPSSPLYPLEKESEQMAQVPHLRTIRFKMDDPGLGENYIGRNTDNTWEWRCRHGHRIQEESREWVPIRAFCSALPAECEVCKGIRRSMERMAQMAD